MTLFQAQKASKAAHQAYRYALTRPSSSKALLMSLADEAASMTELVMQLINDQRSLAAHIRDCELWGR